MSSGRYTYKAYAHAKAPVSPFILKFLFEWNLHTTFDTILTDEISFTSLSKMSMCKNAKAFNAKTSTTHAVGKLAFFANKLSTGEEALAIPEKPIKIHLTHCRQQ